MHKEVRNIFENICTNLNIKGSVLEIGAMPRDSSLLNLTSLQNAREKTGINLDGPFQHRDYRILRCNANNMDIFEDNKFDLVLSNATLEHDKFFWKTINEIHRVTKSGGFIIIGVPGYKQYDFDKKRLVIRKLPLIKKLIKHKYLNLILTGTLTFKLHNAPGDYYRFSPQTLKEVFLKDMNNIRVHSIMLPPRLIGIGQKI